MYGAYPPTFRREIHIDCGSGCGVSHVGKGTLTNDTMFTHLCFDGGAEVQLRGNQEHNVCYSSVDEDWNEKPEPLVGVGRLILERCVRNQIIPDLQHGTHITQAHGVGTKLVGLVPLSSNETAVILRVNVTPVQTQVHRKDQVFR